MRTRRPNRFTPPRYGPVPRGSCGRSTGTRGGVCHSHQSRSTSAVAASLLTCFLARTAPRRTPVPTPAVAAPNDRKSSGPCCPTPPRRPLSPHSRAGSRDSFVDRRLLPPETPKPYSSPRKKPTSDGWGAETHVRRVPPRSPVGRRLDGNFVLDGWPRPARPRRWVWYRVFGGRARLRDTGHEDVHRLDRDLPVGPWWRWRVRPGTPATGLLEVLTRFSLSSVSLVFLLDLEFLRWHTLGRSGGTKCQVDGFVGAVPPEGRRTVLAAGLMVLPLGKD